MTHRSAPDALLLIAPGCPHCAVNLSALTDLVKEGRVGRLEVVNIAVRDEPARSLGVRSAPWTRIGPFDLEGRMDAEELRIWAARVHSLEGMAAYLQELLLAGRLKLVTTKVREEPSRLLALVHLLRDPDTETHVRVGIGALLEDLQGTGIPAEAVSDLALLTQHEEARIRQDACHFLALTGSAEALGPLRRCLDDPDPEVREVAEEGIEALQTDGN
jgi:hypothetical protein